jgi:methanogenic corrinoid protein MtbC1
VEYLGPDLPIDDLVDYAHQEKPAMLCMCATMEENALRLTRVKEKLSKIRPIPVFGYGGQAFTLKPDLRQKVPGEYLGDTIAEGVKKVEQILG